MLTREAISEKRCLMGRSRAAAPWRARAISIVALAALTVLCAAIAERTVAHERPARAADDPLDAERLALIKAGAVRHLPGHTEWPEDRFGDEDDRLAPIIITIVGHDWDGFDRYLIRATASARAHERAIIIRRIEFPGPRPGQDEPDEEDLEAFRQQVREAHVLYIGLTEGPRQRFRRILDWVDGHSILTVSFIHNFAERGGMLRLSVRENRLAMDANFDRIRKHDLKVSSSVLRLANIVTSPDRTPAQENGT